MDNNKSTFSFGTTGAATSGNLFGSIPAATSGPTPTSTNATSSSLFSNLPSKAPGSSPFGFGSSINAAGSTTPAAPKPVFTFPTTTPAAAPPQPAPNPGLFGGAGTVKSNLFGNSTGNTPATTTEKSGGRLFGLAKENTPAASSQPTTPSLFGAASQATPGPLFGGTQPATQSMFAQKPTGQTTTAASSSPVPAFSLASNNTATQPAASPSLFGNRGILNSSTAASTTPATTSAAPTSGNTLFGNKTNLPPASGSIPSILSGGASTTPNTLFGKKPNANPAASTPSLFGGTPVAAQPASTTASAPATTAGAVPTSTPAPSGGASSLFGNKFGAPVPTTSTNTAPNPQPFGTRATLNTSTNPTAGPSPFGANASTTQAPAILSNQPAAVRLKNKSMDEILTRWATDLTKHQKEFQNLALKVATWDDVLVQNTDAITKLLAKTLQAERDAAEVEKQLSHVEGQQEELEQWLDRYEREADEMIQRAGLTSDVGGVDVDRERTYKLAEKLTDRLEGLNKDLSDVIEEINGVSGMLSNSSGTDDPLSHVVRVLNSHLSQLQKIDAESSVLQSRVQEAQKHARAMGGGDWRGKNDGVEEFYKSFARS